MKRLFRDQTGGLIVEIIIAVAVFAMFSVAIGGIVVANARVTTSSGLKSRAVALAKERMEQVTAIKQSGWAGMALTSPNDRYVVQRVALPAPHYELVPDAAAIGDAADGFTRAVVMVAGRRNGVHGPLAESGSDVDQNVRLVAVTVTWDERGLTRSATLKSYLTNWRGE